MMNRHKFFNDVEAFITWYNELDKEEQQSFRKQALKAVWPELSRQAWYNFKYGKMKITSIIARSIFELATSYDSKLEHPSNIFPTLIFNDMNHIQKYLNKNGMSQAELSRRSGISKQTITQYVAGTVIPSIVKAQNIAEILKCNTDDLFVKEDKRA